jgi:ribonuclease HII
MNFKLEKKLKKRGYQIIIGVDEAGRGPLAGPVVACAVALRNFDKFRTRHKIADAKCWNLVRDSKKLSEKQRENIFDFIHENFYVGVGICNPKIIDRINILQATFSAMRKAIADLNRNVKTKFPKSYKLEAKSCILVDGNKIIPNLNIKQQAIAGGDKKVKSISAASIVAKVTRDHLMQKMEKKYPQYRFVKHKGYGTKLHLEKLKKFGPSPIHRLSFQPVKEANLLDKACF